MTLNSGRTLRVPYAKSTPIGSITEEGALYDETNTEFGEVEIDGIKITAYTQYSEEVEKLPAAEYEAFIISEIQNALMRKIIEQIVKGNGNKQFKGLYDLSVADNTSDLTINEIDSKTLNKIVFEHNKVPKKLKAIWYYS